MKRKLVTLLLTMGMIVTLTACKAGTQENSDTVNKQVKEDKETQITEAVKEPLPTQKELDSLYAENEKFSKRNKDLERQVEDLLAELNKVRRQAKANDDSTDDLQDELDKAKRELKNIRLQNDDLARKLKEYKSAVEAQEAEISMLKQKI